MGPERQTAGQSHFVDLAAIVTLYSICLAISVTVLLAHGYDLQSASFEMISCLSTVGLTIGVTTPTTPPGVLWAGSAGMFLGRLEFLIVVVAVGKVLRDAAPLLRSPRRAASD